MVTKSVMKVSFLKVERVPDGTGYCDGHAHVSEGVVLGRWGFVPEPIVNFA
jgi:hypothetical protein